MENPTGTYDPYEFSNAIGIVFTDHILIHYSGHSNKIHMDNVRKILISKKRKWRWNLLFILLALKVAFIFYVIDLERMFKNFLMFISAILFVLGVVIRDHDYFLIVLTRNDFLKSTFHKSLKPDARTFMMKINSKIKKRRKDTQTPIL